MVSPSISVTPLLAMGSRWPRGMLFCLLAGICGLLSCSKDEEKTAEDVELVPAVLAAIREPAEGQFPDPASTVRFLLDQVKKRDVSEAARVFPIKEHYNYVTMEEYTRHLRMFTYHETPIAGAEFHNLQLALDKLDVYEQVSLICLGMDPDERRILTEKKIEADIEGLRQKFDYSKLGNLEVKELTVIHEEEIEEGIRQDLALERAMGAKKEATVDVEIQCQDVHVFCTFGLIQIEDNWRITGLYGLSGLNE